MDPFEKGPVRRVTKENLKDFAPYLKPYGTRSLLEVKFMCGGREYTHTDRDGILWRFEGNKPISLLADQVKDDAGWEEAK